MLKVGDVVIVYIMHACMQCSKGSTSMVSLYLNVLVHGHTHKHGHMYFACVLRLFCSMVLLAWSYQLLLKLCNALFRDLTCALLHMVSVCEAILNLAELNAETCCRIHMRDTTYTC